MNQAAGVVLIIDDDLDIRECLIDVIIGEGHQVFEAINGKEALELLKTIPIPNLILLDINMPVMGGAEFYRSLREDSKYASIPVVFISAGNDFSKIPKDVQTIRKPFDLDIMISVIKSHCSLKLSDPM